MQNVKVTRKGRKGPVPARLFMIFARKSRMAVIFRRGPSKWVQLIKWNTETDAFEPGQWFNGRIYERRSDLSPDGSLLIYFAQKITGRSLKDSAYTYAWTAISRPPFLTALALWPKGDCWHGGGLSKNDKVVLLNHKPEVSKPHKEHKPHRLLVIPNKQAHGEGDPIFSQRLERDGWTLKSPWQVENRGYPKLFRTVQPELRDPETPGIRVTVPFRFAVGSATFSSGQYRVLSTLDKLWIQDANGRTVAVSLALPLEGMVPEKNGRIVFDCYLTELFSLSGLDCWPRSGARAT